ncbi:MAG TPA: trigger factor, partial [Gammaproteobacteria bacterium]|nr:trigger factor [Gammaproteobacteria bacterium]
LTVAVLEVNESKLPEVDEDFMQQFGVEGGDLEAFRAEVTSNMQRELNNAIKNQVKQQ